MLEWRKHMKNKSQSIGQRLKELRQSRDMTQNELAEKLFVSSKTISKWEKDGSVPETDTLIQIGELFNVTLDYLLTGKSNIKSIDAISKIELACREDNIALLKDINLEEFDGTGKDIKYYVRKYNAKNVRRYLIDYKADTYISTGTQPKRYHICALPKGTTSEDDLVMIAWNGGYSAVARECAKFEEKGYHSFRVFREIDVDEKCTRDYQYLYAQLLGKDGNKKMSFSIAMLDDMKSGVLCLRVLRDKTYNLDKHVDGKLVPDYYPQPDDEVYTYAYIKPDVMKQYLETMDAIDFKNWECKHWGVPLCHFFYTLNDNDKHEDLDYHKFYIAPTFELYKKLTHCIEKVIFETLLPKKKYYKIFVNAFDNEYRPYCRNGLDYETSERVFKLIEQEQEEIKTKKFTVGEF